MWARLVSATVHHPVTTIMVTVAILVFGIVGATRLPVELLPNLAYPTLTIQTTFPNAAPVETEELVTGPIEDRVRAVPGVVRVQSTSREGESEIVLDFAWGTPVDPAMAEVREELDRVYLPQTVTRPIVLRYDPSQEPIVRLALAPRASSDRPRLGPAELAQLRRIADKLVKRELEKLPGVAAIELHGGEENEVLVELDPARLAALGVDADAVVAAISADNVNQPGGSLTEQRNRYLVRTVHEARTPEDIGGVIVRSQGGAELRVRDVARVRLTPREAEEWSLVNGHDAIEIAVFREGDANIVEVANEVLDAIPKLALPDGTGITVLSNRAAFVQSAIREVRDNAILGGALAVLVLLFFLRDLRATAVIALAIPVSLLSAFVPLQALGVTVNVMSLGGLALGVGMLVDNSIVVLESIARTSAAAGSEARSRRENVVAGTSEVAASVVASTLTTIAVFLPMAFVEGIAGQLVADLAYAVSLSMCSSMLVSLTLVPVLECAGFAEAPRVPVAPTPRSWLIFVLVTPLALVLRVLARIVAALGRIASAVTAPFASLYDRTEALYPSWLALALRWRWLVIVSTIVACVACVHLLERQGRTLLPELEQDEFFIQVALPRDASLERTRTAMLAISRAIAGRREVATQFARVGGWAANGEAVGQVRGPYLGQLDVRLATDVVDRSAAIGSLFAAIAAGNIEPRAALQLGHPTLVSVAAPLEVLVFSNDLEAAARHATMLAPKLAAIEGLSDVAPDALEGRPEVRIAFDADRLARRKITVEQAATAIRRAVAGEIATTLFTGEDQLEVRVMLPKAERSSVDDIGNIQIATSAGVPILLRSVADLEAATGPAEVRHLDGRRGVRIQARTTQVDLGRLAHEVDRELAATTVDGVSAALSGQAEQLERSLWSLALAAALAVFLVYVVMASSFESLLHPLIILGTVPLGAAGVALACAITQTPLSAMVGIGVIVIGGIVVNNAIILVHAINDRRGRGMALEAAIIEAGVVRIRPIAMTTLTTVLALIPMALGLGDGADLRQPLAITLIGGLTFSTALTLAVIPCVYRSVPGPSRATWAGAGTTSGE